MKGSPVRKTKHYGYLKRKTGYFLWREEPFETILSNAIEGQDYLHNGVRNTKFEYGCRTGASRSATGETCVGPAPEVFVCLCHCGTTSKPLSSSPGEECAGWVHGDASWARLALLVYVAGCTFVCGCVCVYVSTALQYMPSWPKDGPANEKSSKQTGRRNHLGWKAAVTELISGSPLLPLTTCGR